MLPEEETLLLDAAKAARKAYLPDMDNWDSLKPSAVKAWVDVARAVRDSIDGSYSRASGASEPLRFEDMDAQIKARLETLDLKSEFEASGQPYAELDDDGEVVVYNANDSMIEYLRKLRVRAKVFGARARGNYDD